ncbi:hypothetical protein Amet_1456 [Alkaliphilus metalliredigens QYMF]|uniref:Uncharacterized protein n=1 Tax=Alkaliphilus metalliredigens (strain QYMF) TaxID=293826 RepID=A6TN87_ALKMQ|nr:hypothetical protein [Alkaliphilus metalliredigens]ABR47655.1 hypothetical protein Amet_1456 [Alkaliphilus metalliredigens QYMF]
MMFLNKTTQGTPIIVENENLVFDFSGSSEFSYSIEGRVTATYEMHNPTNDLQSVQMAFPFVGRLDSLLPEDIVITVDDSMVPYEIYIRDVVESQGYVQQEDREINFDFQRIVSTITKETYKGENF